MVSMKELGYVSDKFVNEAYKRVRGGARGRDHEACKKMRGGEGLVGGRTLGADRGEAFKQVRDRGDHRRRSWMLRS